MPVSQQRSTSSSINPLFASVINYNLNTTIMRRKYTCLRKNLYPDGHKYLKKPIAIEISSWKILSKMGGILVLLILLSNVLMAQAPVDLTKCYGSCSSNDFTAIDIFLSKKVIGNNNAVTYVRVGENDFDRIELDTFRFVPLVGDQAW